MQKVYLLLRNNKQVGPFTLDELTTLGLKNTDLVWVEGKSAAWRYPSELPELLPYLSGASQQSATTKNTVPHQSQTFDTLKKNIGGQRSKNIFVSLPFHTGGDKPPVTASPEVLLEQKAEALKQKLQAYTPSTEKAKEPLPVETNLARSLHEVEEQYTNWNLRQVKKKKLDLAKEKIFSFLIVALIIAIPLYLLLKPESAPHTRSTNSVPDIVNTSSGLLEESSNETAVSSEMVKIDLENENDRNIKKLDETNKRNENSVAPSAIVMNENEITKAETSYIEQVEPDIAAETSITEKADSITVRKKTIGQAIDGFFGKFKSNNKDKAETTPGTTMPDARGERRSSKRNETTATALPPNPEELAQLVKVTANEPDENWMMGIKGLKLTLHNQSAYKLNKATVEVAYFDEQNTLLEKKTVLFQNVAANKKVTIGAPDHRLASYTKYQLLTVSGE